MVEKLRRYWMVGLLVLALGLLSSWGLWRESQPKDWRDRFECDRSKTFEPPEMSPECNGRWHD